MLSLDSLSSKHASSFVLSEFVSTFESLMDLLVKSQESRSLLS